MNLILRATASRGKLNWKGDNAQKWLAAICRLEGKDIEVTIKAEQKRRSNRQNAYYWGIVVKVMADAAGYTPDEMHDALRHRLLLHRSFTNDAGEELEIPCSTAKLSAGEFEDYMRACRQFGAEFFGVYIPDPNEVEIEEKS
jgi:hypothetical protein